MKHLQRLILLILILAPIGAAKLFNTASEPFGLLEASQAAQSAADSGDRKGEIAAQQQIVQYQPWRMDAWERAGTLQYALGSYQDAINTYADASTHGKLSANALLNEGKSWKELDDNDKAKEFYRQASESDSSEVDLFLEIASAQEEINDSIGTLATLLRAYDLSPLDTGINYQLGVQFAASQPDNAEKFLKTAELDEKYKENAEALLTAIDESTQLEESADRYVYIGQELSQLEEWQAAASAFLNAIKVDDKDGVTWALLGEAVQHVGEDGYDYLEKAQELNPDSDIVMGLTAVYYRRHQKYEIAIQYLYKALENNPNESTWQIEIGNTLALTGDLSNALNHLQVATLLEPDSWVPWESLAIFSINYNYYVSEIGINAARQALLLVPDSPVLLDIMGSTYFMAGDYDSAERFYLQAIDGAPHQATVLYHLGQLYLEKGDNTTAFNYLREAAEYATDSRVRDAANQLLLEHGGG